MSLYAPNDFEKSFAYRTLKNLQHVEKIAEEETNLSKEQKTVFEATQLLCSFVGFLILPRQSHLKEITKHFPKGSNEERILERIRNEKDKEIYENTYHKFVSHTSSGEIYSDEIEELDEKSLVLHLRNAISHNKAHVYPYSIDDEDGDRDIKGFEFMDKKGKYKFKLKLTLDEIRILATGLCRLMLGEYECFE